MLRFELSQEKEKPEAASVIRLGSEEYAKQLAEKAVEYQQMAQRVSASVHTTVLDVLIVENDLQTAKAIQEILENKNVSCRIVSTADQAFQWCTTHHPSAILLDLELPDSDGILCAKALRAYPNFAATPIIMITGHIDRETMQRAMLAGCDHFVGKPFTKEYLVRAVMQQIDPLHIFGGEKR